MKYCLGKHAPRLDPRNVKLRDVLRADLPPLPERFDAEDHYLIPSRMFCNDTLGDCVIACRANLQMMMMAVDGRIIIPTEDEVKREYFRETGGEDTGLNLTDSLNDWHKRGWIVGGKVCRIGGWASVELDDHEAICRAMVTPGFGLALGEIITDREQQEFEAGQSWDVAGDDSSGGGHCISCFAYTPDGPVVRTWARKQQESWAFFAERADEAMVVWPENHPAINHERFHNALTATDRGQA